jgi:hypothetical protein
VKLVLAAFGAASLFGCTPIEPQAIAVAPQVEITARAQRCSHCGWIESKREILPDAADPKTLQVYEYTVRMGDGSSRVFREELPVTWRLRERLMVIDGWRPS